MCTSSNYYTTNEVRNLKTSNLNIFPITETSHKSDKFFTTDVSINGYKEFYTPSTSIKGGTALYVKEKYVKIFGRSDLKIQNDYFEGVWIEIKNKN